MFFGCFHSFDRFHLSIDWVGSEWNCRYSFLARLQSALPWRFGEAVQPHGTYQHLLLETSFLDPRPCSNETDQPIHRQGQAAAENSNLSSRAYKFWMTLRHGDFSLLNFRSAAEAACALKKKPFTNKLYIQNKLILIRRQDDVVLINVPVNK